MSDWSTGDVVIWDNDAIQHKAIDDYGNEPCTMRRVTAPTQLSGVTWFRSMAKRCAEFGPSKDFDARDERFHRRPQRSHCRSTGGKRCDETGKSKKTDYQGSRESLHLVERWTRSNPTTLEYVAIEDATVWTRPWTIKREFTRQSDEANRIYTEPRCIEGNYGLPELLRGLRMEEQVFAEGRGLDPATSDNASGGFLLEADPLNRWCASELALLSD